MNKGTLSLSLLLTLMLLFPSLVCGQGRPLTIKGKVIDEASRTAIQGAFVEIENASGGSGYSRAYVDASGEFVFNGLPSGVSFNLYVEKDGFTSYQRLQWYVESGKELEFVTVALSREAVLDCRITLSDETTPISRAKVQLKPVRSRPDRYAVYEFERVTSDEGLVTIGKIPAGTYELIIEKEGYITEKIKNLRILTGKKKEMQLSLYVPASISGRVLLTDGETLLSGIPIVSRGPSASTSTSNFKGLYRLNDLKPGTYGFTATKSGFRPYVYQGEVTVKEGEQIQGVDHLLQAENEKIKIAIYQEVYPLKKQIEFTVRAFRSEAFKLEFYRIPIKWYLKRPQEFHGLLEKATSLKNFKMVHSVDYGFPRYRPFQWFTQEVLIEEPFKPGILLVRATTDHAEDRNFIFVSNLGLVVKRGKGSLLAYAVNFETNLPEKNVELFVLKKKTTGKKSKDEGNNIFQRVMGLFKNEAVLFKGKTDRSGIFRNDQSISEAQLIVMGLKPEKGVAIAESQISSTVRSEGTKYYFYTDRPIYRPGQRVFFKGIGRVDAGEELRIENDKKIHIDIKDPEGRLITTLTKTTDNMGAVNGAFELPGDAALGRYTLWVQEAGAVNAAYFFVQAYRKPDFKIDMETDKAAYVTGDTVGCKIQAAYFFGSPLSNVTLTYRIYQKMTRTPYYRFWWEGEYYRQEGFQSLIKSGSAKTDSQGFVSLEVMPPPKSYDRVIIIEAEIVPPSGRKVTGRKSVVYNQSLYNIELVGKYYIQKMNQPLSFRVNIKDIDGNPVGTPFTASLEEEVWNPIRSRYEKPIMPLYMETFKTDEAGTAIVEIPVADLKAGYLRLSVSATDTRGGKASNTTYFWIYDDLYGDFNYHYTGLEVWLDKSNYREGETAKLLINTAVENGTILFTTEGQEILEHRVIGMKGRTRIIEIPVRASFAPNIWVSVLQHNENRLYHKKVSLNVAVEGKEMTIKTSLDKNEYRPRDRARLNIKATDDKGRPVQGDFSLGVVDEAIYYIRPDHTTPIHRFFYDKRSPWIATTYSFPIRYLGGAVKDKGDRVIRTDFRDTAFWLPGFSTDQQGQAEVEIPLPDNLTTWVATIRGQSEQNIFGENRDKLLVTKPLITSLKLPRFFIRGDQTEVTAVNHNRTDSPLEDLETTLEVNPPLELLNPPGQILQIPKQGTGRLSWGIKVNKGPQETALTLKAETGSLFDAEQRMVPVLSKGLPQVFDYTGQTSNLRGQITFDMSNDHDLTVTNGTLEFTPHPALAAVTSLNYLSTFPYGCVEQTLNSFVPLAVFYDALKAYGGAGDDVDGLKKKIERGIIKIGKYQNDEGGFGWWRGSESDLYLTSLVILGITRVKDLHPGPSRKILDKAVEYVRRSIFESKLQDTLAFGLYALSETGKRHEVLTKTLKSQMENMDALTLSLTIPAMVNYGLNNDALKAARLLLNKMESGPEGAYFPEPPSYLNRQTVETTAYALSALLKVLPDHPKIEEIVKWLALQKTGNHWISTKTTAVVVTALSEYLIRNKERISLEDQTVTLQVNGKEIPALSMRRSEILKGKGQRISIPAGYMVHGENRVTLSSEHDVYYTMRVNTMLEEDPVVPASSRCDMPVAKQIYDVTRVHDSRGNPRILSRSFEKGEDLLVGQEIKIELRFTPDRDYRFFILEDGLPSGFEVVDFEKSTGLPWWTPYSHKERRDEKVVFFFDHLRAGREVNVEYILRSELEGTFFLPPARLYGMYSPTISSNSGSGTIRVKP